MPREHGIMLPMVRLLVNYMEQRDAPCGRALPPPRSDATVRIETPSTGDYLDLYREVGEPVQWDDRYRMSSDALSAFLQDAATTIFVLSVGGAWVGLCEACLTPPGEAEITNFGLVPRVQGQKLGPFLLDHALRALWSRPLRRIWLHTDTNDHPNAVKVYEKAGFRTYDRRWQDFPD